MASREILASDKDQRSLHMLSRAIFDSAGAATVRHGG